MMKISNELISIIIPVYNVEDYLRKCLCSVLDQTYTNIEIIIINDGSTDNSFNICKEFAEHHKGIILVNQDNAGLGTARNHGLKLATGKFVLFVDSDDFIEHDMVSNLYYAALKNNADTVIAGYKKIYGKIVKKISTPYSGKTVNGEDIKTEVLTKMFANNGCGYIEMSVWKTLFSREIIKSNKILFPDRKLISEDIIFDIQYYSKCRCVYFSDDTSYCYRFNPNSLSQGYRKDKFDLLIYQSAVMKQMSKKFDLPEECMLRTDFYLLGNTIHFIKQLIANESRNYSLNIIRKIVKNEQIQKLAWNRILKVYGIRNKIMAINIMKKNVRGTYFSVKTISSLSRLLKNIILYYGAYYREKNMYDNSGKITCSCSSWRRS